MSDAIPLEDVEQALNASMKEAQGLDERPVQRSRMSNLVIFCSQPEQAEAVALQVPAIVALHPARVLLLVGEAVADKEITATVTSWCQQGQSAHQRLCSEQVTLRAGGYFVERLPFAVRGLLLGDLPINMWWAVPQPPPLAGPLLAELAENAQQVIYDSIGWLEPARGVAATATWLERFERDIDHGCWRIASDLNWRRLKYWRRVLGQALDPATAPGALASISDVLVEHGPHAVIQGWELVSWLAARLGWRVLTGRVQPGTEIGWRFYAEHGDLRVRIHRLPVGPPEIRRVRIACTLGGHATALNITVEDERRLAVTVEDGQTAARTVTVQPQGLAELVGRQLSDREHDPVFRESMTVAQILARSVLA